MGRTARCLMGTALLALMLLQAGSALAGTPVENATWSAMKALYRGDLRKPSVSSDPIRGRSRGLRYPLRTSPDNVLAKIQQSYVAMDADGYLDCLAEEFIFYVHPENVQDPVDPLPEYWGKTTESTLHHNMFGAGSTLESVELSFDVVNMVFDPGEDPVDPSDDMWVYELNYDLWLHYSDHSYHGNEGSVVRFGVDPWDQGPGGETLWEVIHWFDVELLTTVHRESWSTIKALFR